MICLVGLAFVDKILLCYHTRQTAVKAGIHMKGVFGLGITSFTQISRSLFKLSRISVLISGAFCKFFGDF